MNDLIKLTQNESCKDCKICCRFPEESPNLKPSGFKLKAIGEAFICEAYDCSEKRCTAYENRPLDCKIYPFAIARSIDKENVLLVLDNLCPNVSNIIINKDIFKAKVEPTDPIEWEDTFIPLIKLKNTGETNTILNPLELNYFPFFKQFIPSSANLSGFTFAYHFLWQDFFKFYWKIIDSSLCIFAKDIDNLFMPVPPLSKKQVKASVFERCFKIMESFNKGRTESRIENIPKNTSDFLNKAGYKTEKKDEEYIYSSKAIYELKGDKYKHIRWLNNKFEKENKFTYAKFTSLDTDECYRLFNIWHEDKIKKAQTDNELFLLKNISKAHFRAFVEGERMGLNGRVLKRGIEILAYSFGAEINRTYFCVLLEISHPKYQGSSQTIFKRLTGEFKNHKFVNTMGDENIEHLKANKLHYHPVETVPEFIAYLRT